MWLFPKRWRGWAMNKLHSLLRGSPQPQSLHVSYEKGGLILHDAAIPWNADAVLVEASLKLPHSVRRKSDFTLRLPERSPIPAESLRPEDGGERFRLFFRLATPDQSVEAELFWKEHRRRVVSLRIMSMSEFTDG